MWDLPRPGFEPVSPALAGGFLTTAQPGKSKSTHKTFNKIGFFSNKKKILTIKNKKAQKRSLKLLLLCLKIKTHDWSAFNHGRISGTRFAILPKTRIKLAKIYKATVFRKWITSGAHLRSLREGKYEVSLSMAPVFCLGTPSCPNTRRTSPNKAARKQTADFWAQGFNRGSSLAKGYAIHTHTHIHTGWGSIRSSTDHLLWGWKVVKCKESFEVPDCYGLNICVPTKFTPWSSNPQHCCSWRLDAKEVIQVKWGHKVEALIKEN